MTEGPAPTQTVEPSPHRAHRQWPRPRRALPWSFLGTERASDSLPEGSLDRDVLKRDSVYRRALAAADLFSAGLAIVIGVAVVGGDRLLPWWLLALPFVVLVSKAIRLYDRDENVLGKTSLDEAPALFQVATLYALLLWLTADLFVEGHLGRGQVLGIWGLLFGSMLVGRWGARRLARALVAPERCVVVGDPRAADRIQARFDLNHSYNARVVGRVGLPGDRRKAGLVSEFGDLETLGLVLGEHAIHRVIVAPMASDGEEILHAIRLVKSMGVKVSVLPRLFEIVGTSVEFDNVGGVQLLGLRRGGLSRSSMIMKRALDLVGAGLGLIVLSPVLLVIAAAVKLTSPGSVLFRQARIGREGRRFSILKFRSMVADAETQKPALRSHNEAREGLFKIAEDPRITPVGHLLRTASLDELPQLINVLRGEMSLVGPRPLVPDEDEQIDGWHRTRLELAPGMTGFWQINGSSRVPLPEMVKIDYLYGANWSLWLDIKILLRTLPYALSRRGL